MRSCHLPSAADCHLRLHLGNSLLTTVGSIVLGIGLVPIPVVGGLSCLHPHADLASREDPSLRQLVSAAVAVGQPV